MCSVPPVSILPVPLSTELLSSSVPQPTSEDMIMYNTFSQFRCPNPMYCPDCCLVPNASSGLHPPAFPPPTVLPPGFAVAHVAPWKQAYGMEQVWLTEFAKLFSQYQNDHWTLLPVSSTPIGSWYQFVDSAKVRFCCENCGHGWTSMKGRIAYWFLQTPSVSSRTSKDGVVTFKLYGQQCDKCKSGKFEDAMWYPEEVVKVLVNIYNRVGQVYYGFYEAPIHKERRPGKPRTPHNALLCQACFDGVCTENK